MHARNSTGFIPHNFWRRPLGQGRFPDSLLEPTTRVVQGCGGRSNRRGRPARRSPGRRGVAATAAGSAVRGAVRPRDAGLVAGRPTRGRGLSAAVLALLLSWSACPAAPARLSLVVAGCPTSRASVRRPTARKMNSWNCGVRRRGASGPGKRRRPMTTGFSGRSESVVPCREQPGRDGVRRGAANDKRGFPKEACFRGPRGECASPRVLGPREHVTQDHPSLRRPVTVDKRGYR